MKAFFHDLFTTGNGDPEDFDGLMGGIANHLGFTYTSLVEFFATGNLLSLAEGAFMAVFGTTSEIVTNTWDMASAVVGGVGEAFGSFFEGVGNAFDEFGDAFGDLFSGDIGGFFDNMFDGFGEFFGGIFEGIGDIFEGIGNAFSYLWPVVLDLDGDGIELLSIFESKTNIAVDDGMIRAGWVAADDAILVYDGNTNGVVDSSAEYAFIEYLSGARTDLEGLSAFDTNANGLLDAGDAAFADFRVWQDGNGNGVSDPGEMTSLTEVGIASINLALNGNNYIQNGNRVSNTSSYTTANGDVYMVGDVAFTVSTAAATTTLLANGATLSTSEAGMVALTATAVGGVLELDEVMASDAHLANILGNTGNDILTLSANVRGALFGEAGSDQLTGSVHGDLLEGGAGSDVLAGGSGQDVYAFNADFGHDVVVDHQGGSTFVFGDAELEDLEFAAEGDDLLISIADADVVRIKDWATNAAHLEDVVIVDGAVFDHDAVTDWLHDHQPLPLAA